MSGEFDLRTGQWLGHSDMESTIRCLKPSRSRATFATRCPWAGFAGHFQRIS
jgi:hypothetical protein